MFWALTYLIRRLKGILNNMAGDDDIATSVMQRSSRKGTAGADTRAASKRQSQHESRKRKRKRSRSVPNMQVKIAEKKATEESKVAAEGKLEPSLRIVRAASMETSRAKGRKKSLAGGGSSGFKHFKNFVESKILSKSSHDVVVNGSAAEGGSSVGTSGLRATGGSAKDSFQRRSSRTSVAEFDPLLSSPTGNNRDDFLYVKKKCSRLFSHRIL